MGRERRKFSKEFKEEVVRLVEAGDRPAQEVAESLGINHSLLSRWQRAKEHDGAEAFRASADCG